MATESSAVVRFISLAQRQQTEVVRPLDPPLHREGVASASRLASRALLWVPLAALLAGATAGVGIFFHKRFSAGGSAGAAVTAGAPVAAPEAAPGLPASPGSAAPGQAEPGAPVVSVPPDLLAETGFDVRVVPAAKVLLDGVLLGDAPLRVRNLQPGVHVLEVEGPDGYFARRLEIDLIAGEPHEIKLRLDPKSEPARADKNSRALHDLTDSR